MGDFTCLPIHTIMVSIVTVGLVCAWCHTPVSMVGMELGLSVTIHTVLFDCLGNQNDNLDYLT